MDKRFNDPNCFIGKGAQICLAPTVPTTIAPQQTFTFNKHVQNNTKVKTGRCDREFFIFNPLNEDKIWLNLPGRYTFAVLVETTPAINTVVSIINEANQADIPLYTGVAGTVSLIVPERGSIVKLVNTGTVPIVLTPGTNLAIPLVIVTITYEGL
jgi:hypothetical protein